MAKNPLTPYQGIWRDQSRPSYDCLVITLGSYQSLSLLALVASLIAYAQTRWWIITRYLLIRVCWPNSLDDSENPGSPRHLSQVRAIKLLIFKEKHQENVSMTPIPPWFGLASLFNLLVFVVLGTIIPYFMTGSGGPAKAQAYNNGACHGVAAYSTSSVSLAQKFYAQCRLDLADQAACGYLIRIVDTSPKLNFTLDPQCPFEQHNCVGFRPNFPWPSTRPDEWGSLYHKAIKIAYLDLRPSDYGLNTDSKIRQSHSLTCAPIYSARFRAPESGLGVNETVFWFGYPTFNQSEKYSSIGQSIAYYNPPPLVRPYLHLDSIALYELQVYPALVKYPIGKIYENFHPGLKSEDGDVLVVRFKYDTFPSTGVPFYTPWKESVPDPMVTNYGALTTALACVEQYQICYDDKCMGWSNETEAISKMYQFLQSNYDSDIASEVLKVHGLLIKASTIRRFLSYNDHSSMMIRSILQLLAPEARNIFMNSSRITDLVRHQWLWEVQSWFEMSFLAAKLNLLDSAQGVKKAIDSPYDQFSNTSWICNKVFFLDENSTNIDFFGLMTTLLGILMLCLLSYLDIILDLIKRALKICRKVFGFMRTASKRLWSNFCHGMKGPLKWVQLPECMVKKFGRPFQATRSTTQQFRRGDYDDEEIPSSTSFRLENLSSNS